MRKGISWFSRSAALLALCALGLMWSPSARADSTPCLTGTIATVMAQGPCTIGDMTFDFTSYNTFRTGDASPDAATDVYFTPLTGNPLNPGFELSAFSARQCTDCASFDQGFLYYDASVTNGSANLIGVNESADYTFFTDPLPPPNGGWTLVYADIGAENYLSTIRAGSGQGARQSQYGGSSPVSSSSSSGPVMFAPLSSGSGYASFGIDAYSTSLPGGFGGLAEADMPSVDYTFLEQPPSTVPEPSTLVLCGTGLIMFGGILRRQLLA